jgi:Domain of unknown function (DUF2017)
VKVTRTGTGSSAQVRLRVDDSEAALLSAVFDDLLIALDEMGPGDPVWERLYPAVYDEADAAEEFREMVGEDLDNARRERLGACQGELSAAPVYRRGREVRLDPESLERWIMALNDLRLSLGTRLDIRAGDTGEVDPSDPQAHDRMVYGWLTWIQDALVGTAMTGSR